MGGDGTNSYFHFNKRICNSRPMATPGMTDNIGSQMGPKNMPAIVTSNEYIKPTVTE